MKAHFQVLNLNVIHQIMWLKADKGLGNSRRAFIPCHIFILLFCFYFYATPSPVFSACLLHPTPGRVWKEIPELRAPLRLERCENQVIVVG